MEKQQLGSKEVETHGQTERSGSNVAGSCSSVMAPRPEADREDVEAVAMRSLTSPHSFSFIASPNRANMSKDDNVINLLLNKHGDSETVAASLDSLGQ